MGWQDRQYRPPRDEGGFRRALRRVFGGGGGFLSWAFPLFTLAGIRVRIHFLFVLYIAGQLIFSMEPGKIGFLFTAVSLATLFTIVLIHEFGHCIACRRVGGEANDILMWPLGGLASVNPPHDPKAALITTVGGPFVHLLIAPVLAGVLLALGAPVDALLIKPLNPWASLSLLAAPGNDPLLYARVLVFSAYVMNAYLFVFNVFLPMYPMDGGRILQEILWFRMGYRRSMQVAVQVGLITAIVVGAMSFMRGANVLMGIAILCGFTCWQERQKLAMMEPETFSSDYGYKARPIRERTTGGGGGGAATKVRPGPTKAEIKRQQSEQELNAEIDRILEKIRTEGMASLTKKEKATLQGETERKRRESAGG